MKFVNYLKDIITKIKNRFNWLKIIIKKIKETGLKSLFKMPDFEKGFINFIAHFWHRITALIVIFIVVYYPLGAVLTHDIDDRTDFSALNVEEGASYTVATMAELIKREVDDKTWTANLPFFFPSYALDNMPNYQMGIVSALSRFALELTDQLGRTRGSSQADNDLESAAGLLKYSGKIWIIDPSTSFMPTASSNKQYRSARRKLLAYNDRLAKGKAVFERRADNLQGTLDRIAKDLGSVSEIIDKQVLKGEKAFIDFNADDVFYNSKGKIYAYYLILRDLEKDFSSVIQDKDLKTSWERMLESFKNASTLQPFVVVNGKVDGQFLPSHLSSFGFYLLRARTQLQEVSSIIIK